MNLNGLWTAEFWTGHSVGTGVAVLIDGALLGGDSGYYYTGVYAEKDGKVSGHLRIFRYAAPPQSVFGLNEFDALNIEAAASETLILGQCYAIGPKPHRMSVKLTRVTNLPVGGR